MSVAIHETAWRPFASNCKAVSLILGLLLLSYPRPAQSAVPAAGAELNRLRISIPGLGSLFLSVDHGAKKESARYSEIRRSFFRLPDTEAENRTVSTCQSRPV
jgi:hypothetical protein